MDIIRREFFYPSSNGGHDIFACTWSEKGREHFKGIVQIAHGMSEHIIRYESLAIYLVKQGYLVCGNDHRGHGQSVESEDDFGYFGDEDENWHFLIKDMYSLMKRVQKENEKTKYFLLGHSMGSFLARAFIAEYGEFLNGVILMGTSSGHRFIDAAIAIANESVRHRGGKTRGGYINKLMVDFFNVRCLPVKTAYDWISSDHKVVDAFMKDERCAFMFTYSGYRDLFNLLKSVNLKSWYDKVPKNLPIFLISGEEDPVGDYGRGVKKVYEHLLAHECKNVSIKVFKNMRHEIINEKGKCLAYREISQWLRKNF